MVRLIRVYVCRVLVATVACSLLGCIHSRCTEIAMVDDVGPIIVTKNRYRYSCDFRGDGIFQTQNKAYNVARDNKLENMVAEFNDKLKKAQPQVFGDDGIPFVIRSVWLESDVSYGWTRYFPFLASAFTLPQCITLEQPIRYEVDVLGNPDAHGEFEIVRRTDTAVAMFTPSPAVFYMGDIGLSKYGKRQKYTEHEFSFCSQPFLHLAEEACAYGIASELKKMEDEGRINATPRHGSGIDPEPVFDGFDLVAFRREGESEHLYSFVFKCRDNVSLHASRVLQKTIRTMIRKDFATSFPTLDAESVIVDFTEYSISDGYIIGRAVAVTLQVMALDYNKYTRKGTMSIRVNANQYEDARKCIVENIASLARHKNIVIKSDKLPPSTTYHLLEERFKDGIYEIEFKTE